MAYGYLQNPYEADRNISGRWGRVFLGGDWVAQAHSVTWAVAIDKSEVKRSGTRWNDQKSGSYTGTGSLSYSKVNSLLENILIPFINATLPTVGGVEGVAKPAGVSRRMPVFELQVTLEDPAQPGANWDAAGNMITGQETVQLHNVKFWNLEGGYADTDVERSVEFSFSGINLLASIDDPQTPEFDGIV